MKCNAIVHTTCGIRKSANPITAEVPLSSTSEIEALGFVYSGGSTYRKTGTSLVITQYDYTSHAQRRGRRSKKVTEWALYDRSKLPAPEQLTPVTSGLESLALRLASARTLRDLAEKIPNVMGAL
jgi:trans-2-enoyl-CoA reductase